MQVNQGSSENRVKNTVEAAQPMWKIVLSQFLEHRLAVFGSCVIFTFVMIAIFADLISFVSGVDPKKQNVTARYLHPFKTSEATNETKENAFDAFIRDYPAESAKIIQALGGPAQEVQSADTDTESAVTSGLPNESRIYDLSGLSVEGSIEKLKSLKIAEAKPLIAVVEDFKTFHIFGTDELGRDVAIRLVYGTRVSLGVGVLVAFVSAMLGMLIGSMAGFYGGAIEVVLMRITDAFIALPTIPFLIVLAAIDLQKVEGIKAIVPAGAESGFKMFCAIILFSWMTVARLVHGSVLSLREREFVLASKTLGAKDSTLIIRHMFPNVIAPMVVAITLGVGQSILFEAALSFLGLGIMPPTPSWGNMLNNAQEVMYKNVWLALLPGIMILLTTISFNFMGDGLQDAVDPKAIRR
ncbi:MAG: ABC transporter permease [Pseudobdellovibrionaceae bacterium]